MANDCAETSLAAPAGLRPSSLLDRALAFWEQRLSVEAGRRADRDTIDPWADRPAERYLAMERAVLRLWREPRAAAEELFELGAGDLKPEIASRLGQVAPLDCCQGTTTLTPLPWQLSDLDDRSRYLLAERGLGGVRHGDLKRPGRLGLGLGALGSVAVWLLFSGAWGREEVVAALQDLEVVEVDSEVAGSEGVEMKFVPLSGGTFRMGSEVDDKEAFPDEQPAHDVTVSGFWMGQTEVTHEQYRVLEPDHESEGGADHPAVNISWVDARAYCQALGRSEAWEYDLPTEAEWEYAARADTTTQWSFGDEEADLAAHAWFSGNSGFEAQPVAGKIANPWNLYDVHGNVWEWVLDCWDADAYQKRVDTGRIVNPGLEADSCHQGDTSPGALRVLRGGAFLNEPGDLRSAFRLRVEPVNRNMVIGFRCVRRPVRQR